MSDEDVSAPGDSSYHQRAAKGAQKRAALTCWLLDAHFLEMSTLLVGLASGGWPIVLPGCVLRVHLKDFDVIIGKTQITKVTSMTSFGHSRPLSVG